MKVNKFNCKLVLFCAILLLVAVSLAVFRPKPVDAISYKGPDPAEFNIKLADKSSPNGKYVVANSDNTGNQSRINIPIYYVGDVPPGSVDLTVSSMDQGANSDQYLSADGGTPFFTSDTQVVKVKNFGWDSNTGVWKKDVSFTLNNHVKNKKGKWEFKLQSFYHNRLSFRLSLKNTGHLYIGNGDGGDSDNFNIIASNPSAGQNKGYEYDVEMATPNAFATDQKNKTVKLFDLDSNGDDNEGRKVTVQVIDETAGKTIWNKTNDSKNGGMGQNDTYTITMTFKACHKYKLKIKNISPINLIQYRLPYDSINYVTGCPIVSGYSLTPAISLDHGVAQAGEDYSAVPSVGNSGPNDSANTSWQITKVVVPPGNNPPNEDGGNSNLDPCGTYFSSSGISCSTVKSGTSVFEDSGAVKSGSPLNNYGGAVDDLPPGTKLCFSLSVKPRSGESGEWAHSPLACLTIGIKPKAQIWGGDLLSGGDVTGSAPTSVGGKSYGNWVEYAIFAQGVLSHVASGSAFNGGLPSATKCSYSTLSFTNAGDSGNCEDNDSSGGTIGNYNSAVGLPDIASSFPGGSPISGSVTVNNLINAGASKPETRIYDGGNSDITLQANSLPAGHTVVIKTNGTVTIADNQSYANGPYANIKWLPQLLIIANKIVINPGATNVDAWLVAEGADGEIDTCNAEAKDVNHCNQVLKVNGPVITQSIKLWRTGGAGTGSASGDPAEIFNLRADAYLWAIAHSTSTQVIRSSYTTELPPRL